jgi:TatD DNase family protein
VIDTHCHLTFPDFRGRVSGVMAEAERRGVTGAISISTTSADCLEALALAKEHGRVWCTAGVHPLHSHEGPHHWANLGMVAADPRCVAWGELGLDNHYEEPAPETQMRVLGDQLGYIETFESSATRRLPIVVHCREAFDDLLPVLRRSGLDPTRFVFHCFTGTPAEVRRVLDFGGMVSFTGIVTYKNARDVQEAARVVPLSRLMCETDAPYLSPEPHRTTRPCEPWMSAVTARFLADLRGEPWEAFHEAINANARAFFGVDAR